MAAFKNILRSIIVLVLILGAGFFGLWFLRGSEIKIQNQSSKIYPSPVAVKSADQFFDIGGKTPQETLNLFIGALEKDDLILAVKYFIPESREVESEDLTKLDTFKLIGDLIKDLKNIKSGQELNNGHYKFKITDEMGQAAAELELIKNENGFWKIISL